MAVGEHGDVQIQKPRNECGIAWECHGALYPFSVKAGEQIGQKYARTSNIFVADDV
jgi:hypothetical protein